jgi:hypothetical protein
MRRETCRKTTLKRRKREDVGVPTGLTRNPGQSVRFQIVPALLGSRRLQEKTGIFNAHATAAVARVVSSGREFKMYDLSLRGRNARNRRPAQNSAGAPVCKHCRNPTRGWHGPGPPFRACDAGTAVRTIRGYRCQVHAMAYSELANLSGLGPLMSRLLRFAGTMSSSVSRNRTRTELPGRPKIIWFLKPVLWTNRPIVASPAPATAS